MDKKAKKNGGGSGISDDKDGADQQASESASASVSPSKSKPAHIAPGSAHNGDKSKAGTNSGSDKDSTPVKSHLHVQDDAGKQGPQKKRRKVTHGTAALTHPPTCLPFLRAPSLNHLNVLGLTLPCPPACLLTPYLPMTGPRGAQFCRLALILCPSRSYSLRILPSICKSRPKSSELAIRLAAVRGAATACLPWSVAVALLPGT